MIIRVLEGHHSRLISFSGLPLDRWAGEQSACAKLSTCTNHLSW